MPYIDSAARDRIANGGIALTAGELNYELTNVVLTFVETDGRSYQRFNDAIGALECAKQELYRRMVAPYEDKKCAENGDVYP